MVLESVNWVLPDPKLLDHYTNVIGCIRLYGLGITYQTRLDIIHSSLQRLNLSGYPITTVSTLSITTQLSILSLSTCHILVDISVLTQYPLHLPFAG